MITSPNHPRDYSVSTLCTVQVTVDYNSPFDLTLEGVNVTNCKKLPYSTTENGYVSKDFRCQGSGERLRNVITYKYIGPTGDDMVNVRISVNLKPGTGTAFAVKMSGMFSYLVIHLSSFIFKLLIL